MFLRCHPRKKNGKAHRYWSVVESRRLNGGNAAQRQVLYLGEINDSQQAAWRKTISVFDERSGESCELSLFPDDRPVPADALDAVSVVLSEMKLLRPRRFGDCWLGRLLWQELHLDRFWQDKLSADRGGVPWEKVLQLLVVNRLCDPGSEFAVHRRWFLDSAMDELLGLGFAVAEKDRLYRCLDRVLAHKDELCKHLVGRWKTLFDAKFDVLLYDLTSTYFEGGCADIPKAKHGYSRDGRPDCRQVVIALVVTTDGLPLAYEVLAGNTLDHSTLGGFLGKIETLHGKARRVWVMDRGIPTEATRRRMRDERIGYLVGTPKHLLKKMEKDLLDKPWEQVYEGMRVKLLEQEGELFVLAQSRDRRKKENAMRRRKLKALVKGLNRLRCQMIPRKRRRKLTRDHLLRRVAVLKKTAGRIASLLAIREPEISEEVSRATFTYTFNHVQWRQSLACDGSYILRAWLPWDDCPGGMEKQAPALWAWYMQLTHVEEAFKTLKSDLHLRPIHHQLEHRVEAHILVAFLGYCLQVTLRRKLQQHAPGLTPREALASLGAIKLVDVHFPTTDGRTLILPRFTQPEPQQRMILEKLGLTLPPQPPPRIRAAAVATAAEVGEEVGSD
jgi:Transposase DDE domain